MNDLELLREYAAQGSEDAFATLVSRYARLVYSAAFRQCGHVQDAEEITQAVFVILARKAGGLRPDTVLPGWLLRTTRFVAMNARRRQRYRRLPDHDEMNENRAVTDATWQQLAPVLDEALERLSVKDRDAVVLRYFDQRSFKEIAGLTAATEDGAQKRVTRAVEKLRVHFQRRGLVLSSAAILTTITANAVQAAPAHLTTTIVAAVTSGTALTGSVAVLVKTSIAALNAARLKILGLWATTAALLLPVAWLFVSGSLSKNQGGIPVNPATLSWGAIAASADGAKLAGTVTGVGLIYSSTDSGTNWRTTGAPQGLWYALASSADGTKLLAVGSDYEYITNGFNVATIATTSRIYTSANSGAKWTQARGTPTNVTWTAAASSADGTKLVVGATSGAIYTSANMGRTWTLRDAPIKQWNSIASSGDGARLVAVAVKGGIYTSTDSGVTWTPCSVPSDLLWWDVASSADGSSLVAVAVFDAQGTAGSPIYVSTNAGTNWVATSAPSNNWGSVGSSADATTLVAAGSSNSPAGIFGVIFLSRDSGATWMTTDPPRPGSIWKCVAVSADGSKIFAGMNPGGIKSIAR